MTGQKKLQRNSKWASVDKNGDGIITDKEIAGQKALVELDNKDKKEDQLRQMAWVAMLSMVGFTAMLFTPFVTTERLSAMDNILSMFYIAQAGVVATFFGSAVFMSKIASTTSSDTY